MKPLVIPFVALVAAAWLAAAVHGFASLAHLSGRRTLGQMLFRGIEWFNADNFTERGQALQRRMVHSMLAFLLAIVALVVVVAITS